MHIFDVDSLLCVFMIVLARVVDVGQDTLGIALCLFFLRSYQFPNVKVS
jgi:hypothetical protein